MRSADVDMVSQRLDLQNRLRETVTQLCCKAIPFRSQLCVEGLLGITVDSENVILVNLKQLVHNDNNNFDFSHHRFEDQAGSVYSEPASPMTNRSSGNRRKRRVTRKAVVNEEDSFMDDEDDDLVSYFYRRGGEEDEEKTEAMVTSDVAMNLVKRENNAENGSRSTLDLTSEVKRESATLCQDKNLDIGLDLSDKSICKQEPKAEGNNDDSSSGILQSTDCQMRRYGAYGYIIHEGNKVMYSCNKCPKLFRNRVSLWRHGVKHKQCLEVQGSLGQISPSRWPCHICPETFSSEEQRTTHIQLEHLQRITSTPSTDPVSFRSSEKTPSSLPASTTTATFPDHVNNKFGDSSGLLLPWQQALNHATMVAAAAAAAKNRGMLPTTSIDGTNDTEVDDPNNSSFQSSTSTHNSMAERAMLPPTSYQESDESNPGNTSSINSEIQDLSKPEASKDATENLRASKEDDRKADARSLLSVGSLQSGMTNMRYRHTRGMPDPESRPIGNYGKVYTTREGKLFVCNECQKSFKNRVSLWKHQFKHNDGQNMNKKAK